MREESSGGHEVLDRIRGDGPDITLEEAKQWYREGWISDDELDEAIETALKEENESQ